MKKSMATLSVCAFLCALPMGAFPHGYDSGDAALGGLVGGVVGGLIGSGVVPAPVYVAPAPIVVEPYAPAPVVVERYAPAPVVVAPAPPPVVYDRDGYRGWRAHEWREHHHWDDDDD
jgi:hypothetical protein